MNVHARFFAAYREILGVAELTVPLAEGSTVAELVDVLRARGGDFAHLPPEPAVAVNRVYVDATARLREGDEVAFIPPVAGG